MSICSTAAIRRSFLDFFAAKGHTIVPSASLMPASPNLLFTNAGMNPFVPYFLGEQKAPYARIANTQKCIRAGGKHNDLEDVGFDTYHHTFFEMLGNWSIGDYFKREAIDWAWELLTDVWQFPKSRLYATVYKPAAGEPAAFDQEAYDLWSALFEREGLDPKIHICFGGRKDNFWMMGETGPCGPCSEIHIDLSPHGDTQGKLVNQGSPLCMEIWNLVFIQFNAEADGTFRQLSAKHVDTGMGLERVAGILATTNHFKDFNKAPSNYNSDLFTPVIQSLSQQSGCPYRGTVPQGFSQLEPQERIDCSLRVLADHIRTLCFAVADGIYPGNEGRNYVLRRILRRAILFGKHLQLPDGFFSGLVSLLVEQMGEAFPELRTHQAIIQNLLENEEKAFERVLERGLQLFEKLAQQADGVLPGEAVFTLYDTYGFPIDLTELIARERNLKVDTAGFEHCMQQQRLQARAAQQKTIVMAVEQSQAPETRFIGYDSDALLNVVAKVLQCTRVDNRVYFITDQTPFYAEMGGQVGDRGQVVWNGHSHAILNTLKNEAGQILHEVSSEALDALKVGAEVLLNVDIERRLAIQRHHTATHLLHWALCEVLGPHVRQAGSLVDADHLRFDFSHYAPLTAEQLAAIEQRINQRILENAAVAAYEVPFAQKPERCKAFFGDKYGDMVRVIDVGGYAVELCGGTHVRLVGELGSFYIHAEASLAAGVRRIEAVVGLAAYAYMQRLSESLQNASQQLGCPMEGVSQRLQQLLEHKAQLEQALKQFHNQALSQQAAQLAAKAQVRGNLQFIIETVALQSPQELRPLAVQLAARLKPSVVILAAVFQEKVQIIALCSAEAIAAGHAASAYIQTCMKALHGKGGGKEDLAMGGAPYTPAFKAIFESFQRPEKPL